MAPPMKGRAAAICPIASGPIREMLEAYSAASWVRVVALIESSNGDPAVALLSESKSMARPTAESAACWSASVRHASVTNDGAIRARARARKRRAFRDSLAVGILLRKPIA